MSGDLILNAYSSNSGGGRAGLINLLKALPPSSRATVFVDQRMILDFALPSSVTIERVPPTVLGRFRAEVQIKNLSASRGMLLRLGSLPPIFRSGAPTFVFFENRFLLNNESLRGLSLKTKVRIFIERLQLRFCKRNADHFLVQSKAMAKDLAQTLGPKCKIRVMPFHETLGLDAPRALTDFDFIYAAAGDSHKNHRRLMAAWCLLAEQNIRPSLCLTISSERYPELTSFIQSKVTEFSLNVTNVGHQSPEWLGGFYRRSRAVIFASVLESFGRPLVEAQSMGLPVLAPELDYVRDILDPAQTFDPASATSIARAVKRFLNIVEPRTQALTGAEFLDSLKELSLNSVPRDMPKTNKA